MIFELLKLLGLFYITLTIFRYIYYNLIKTGKDKQQGGPPGINENNSNYNRIDSKAITRKKRRYKKEEDTVQAPNLHMSLNVPESNIDATPDKSHVPEETKGTPRSLPILLTVSCDSPLPAISTPTPNLHIDPNLHIGPNLHIDVTLFLRGSEAETTFVVVVKSGSYNFLTENLTKNFFSTPAVERPGRKKRRREKFEGDKTLSVNNYVSSSKKSSLSTNEWDAENFNNKKKSQRLHQQLHTEPYLFEDNPPSCVLIMTKDSHLNMEPNIKPSLTFEIERHPRSNYSSPSISASLAENTKTPGGPKLAGNVSTGLTLSPDPQKSFGAELVVGETFYQRKPDTFCKTSKSESPFKVSSNSAFRPINRTPSVERDQFSQSTFADVGIGEKLMKQSYSAVENGHHGHEQRPVHKIIDLGRPNIIVPVVDDQALNSKNVPSHHPKYKKSVLKSKTTSIHFPPASKKMLTFDSVYDKFKIKPVQYSPGFDVGPADGGSTGSYDEFSDESKNLWSAEKRANGKIDVKKQGQFSNDVNNAANKKISNDFFENFETAAAPQEILADRKIEKFHLENENRSKNKVTKSFDENVAREKENSKSSNSNSINKNLAPSSAPVEKWPVKLRNTFLLTNQNKNNIGESTGADKMYARKHKTASIHYDSDDFLGDFQENNNSWAFRQQISPAFLANKKLTQDRTKFTFNEPNVQQQICQKPESNFKIIARGKSLQSSNQKGVSFENSLFITTFKDENLNHDDNLTDNNTTGNVTSKTKLFENIAENEKKNKEKISQFFKNPEKSSKFFKSFISPAKNNRKSDRSHTVSFVGPNFEKPAGLWKSFGSPNFLTEGDFDNDELYANGHHEDENSKMSISEKTRLFEIKSRKSGVPGMTEESADSGLQPGKKKPSNRRKTQPVTQSEVNKARSLLRRQPNIDSPEPVLSNIDNDDFEDSSKSSILERSGSSNKVHSQMGKCKKVFLWS